MQLHLEYVDCKEERYTGDEPPQAYKHHMASSYVLYEQKKVAVHPPI